MESQNEKAALELARRGLQRLHGAKIAKDTKETRKIMASKFVTPPEHQRASQRLPPPPANVLSDTMVISALRTFAKGAGPGSFGLRADFLRQIVGEGDEPKAGAQLLTALVNLLASGKASLFIRPYLGGAKGTALEKVSEMGEADVRPVCSRRVLRRLVGTALLRTELDTLREQLLPHQLAVGIPSV